MKLPKAKAEHGSTCPECHTPIWSHSWVYKDIVLGEWLHPKCWHKRLKKREADLQAAEPKK